MIAQPQGTAKNNLWLNSASNKSGSANTTSEMSGNATGSFKGRNTENWGSEFYGASGCFSISGNAGACGPDRVNRGGKDTVNINVAHTHTIYLGSNDTETKPTNLTVKIWVRTA